MNTDMIGTRIREKRNELGLTPNNVNSLVGIRTGHLSELENLFPQRPHYLNYLNYLIAQLIGFYLEKLQTPSRLKQHYLLVKSSY